MNSIRYNVLTDRWTRNNNGKYQLHRYFLGILKGQRKMLILGKTYPFRTKLEARIMLKRYVLDLKTNNKTLYNEVKNNKFIIERWSTG